MGLIKLVQSSSKWWTTGTPNTKIDFPPPALAKDRNLLANLSSSLNMLEFPIHLLRYAFCILPESAVALLADNEGTYLASPLDGPLLDSLPSRPDTVRGLLRPLVLQSCLIWPCAGLFLRPLLHI